MDWIKFRDMVRRFWKKYCVVVLAVAAGLLLLSMPQEKETAPEPEKVVQTVSAPADLEAELEQILSAVAGAGRVSVLLTEVAGGETVYQTQGEDGDTVLLTGSTRGETALVRRVDPPVYRGAVVVCQGGDNAAVRLAVVQAVMAVTGLNAQRITVLKMK